MRKRNSTRSAPPEPSTEQEAETPSTSACRQMAALGLRSVSRGSEGRTKCFTFEEVRVPYDDLDIPLSPYAECHHPNLSMVLAADDNKISFDRKLSGKTSVDHSLSLFQSDESSDDDDAVTEAFSPEQSPASPAGRLTIDSLFDESQQVENPLRLDGASTADIKGKGRMLSVDTQSTEDNHIDRFFTWDQVYCDDGDDHDSRMAETKDVPEVDDSKGIENQPPDDWIHKVSPLKRPAPDNKDSSDSSSNSSSGPAKRIPLQVLYFSDELDPNMPPKKKFNASSYAMPSLSSSSSTASSSSSSTPRSRHNSDTVASSTPNSTQRIRHDLKYGISPLKSRKGKQRADSKDNNTDNNNHDDKNNNDRDSSL